MLNNIEFNRLKTFIVSLLLITFIPILAKDFTLEGQIIDISNDETLAGATVYIEEIDNGTITNYDGKFVTQLKQGRYRLITSYVGYYNDTTLVNLIRDKFITIKLKQKSEQISEVIIKAHKKGDNLRSLNVSLNKIDIKSMEALPNFMGEPDIMRAISFLPGVHTGGEGSAGMYVRGGSSDQNLILFDNAVVYNPQHFGGLVSVFNQDVIKQVDAYKGGIPSEYGGRLSSLIDIKMKDGNLQQHEGNIAIGNISSKITLQGPIRKNKGSYIVSGRRSYFDLFFGLSDDQSIKDSKIYFSDFNAKINFKIGKKDRLYISGFNWTDYVDFRAKFALAWDNSSGIIKWNHIVDSSLFFNISVLVTNYYYKLFLNTPKSMEFDWGARFIDINYKFDFIHKITANSTLKYGLNSIYHIFEMGELQPGENSNFTTINAPKKNALESALYLENDQHINSSLSIRYGVRANIFNQLGGTPEYNYNGEVDKNSIIGKIDYQKSSIIKTYWGIEPRITARYKLNNSSSLKASYNKTYQFLHQLTTTNSPTPLDIWGPSSKYIKPQSADQYVLGYFKNFLNNSIEISSEIYYKNMYNQIDFVDNAQPLLNDHIETEIKTGEAYAYGLELQLKKTEGNLRGSISYTYSKARRKINGINNGVEYSPEYDKPHDFKIQTLYKISKNWDIGATWQFTTGKPATFPNGKFSYGPYMVQTYKDGGRNNYRLDDYHRLDLSANYAINPENRVGFSHNINISLINVYMRKNPYSLYFEVNETTGDSQAVQLSILGTIIPSITYSLKF